MQALKKQIANNGTSPDFEPTQRSDKGKTFHRKRYSNKRDSFSVNPTKLLENSSAGQEAITKKLKLRIKNSGNKNDSSLFGRIKERNNRSKMRLEKLTKTSMTQQNDPNGLGKLKIKVSNRGQFDKYKDKMEVGGYDKKILKHYMTGDSI